MNLCLDSRELAEHRVTILACSTTPHQVKKENLMAQTNKEQDRKKEKRFLRDVAAVYDAHGSVAERFGLARVDNKPTSTSSGRKKCVRWGIIPGTNKRVCLKWVAVD